MVNHWGDDLLTQRVYWRQLTYRVFQRLPANQPPAGTELALTVRTAGRARRPSVEGVTPDGRLTVFRHGGWYAPTPFFVQRTFGRARFEVHRSPSLPGADSGPLLVARTLAEAVAEVRRRLSASG